MSRRLEAIIDRMAGKAVAALDLHGDEPGMTTKICRTCHVPQPCPTTQVLNADAVQILDERDAEQRRAGAVEALREAADAMLECKRPEHWNLDAQPGSDTGYSPDVWLRARADRIEAQHG